MARADTQTIMVVQNAQGFHELIVVEERLTLTHRNDIGNARSEVVLNLNDLIDHLLGGEVSRESLLARGAERTRHGASDLCGEANSQAVVSRGDADGFNAASVSECEDVFSRSIK